VENVSNNASTLLQEREEVLVRGVFLLLVGFLSLLLEATVMEKKPVNSGQLGL